jgi:hypothetical protein
MTPQVRLAAVAAVALLVPSASLAAEESHVGLHFQVFVPPNASTASRATALVITAQAGSALAPCVVNAVDDGADGDADDTQLGVKLAKGESLIIYPKDGAVNDDMGGKAKGDYFVVDATLPVSVMIASDSDWEHDWAPATSGTLRGSEFFVYAQTASVSARDIDVFAYENGTHVEIYDVTSGTPVVSKTGIARVGTRGATPILSADLNEGQDLNRIFGLGKDIFTVGHVYQVVSTKDVTVLFGSIDSIVNQDQARDGAGFVPGRSGHAIDSDFYFAIPHNQGKESEQELRIVAGTKGATVLLQGWSTATNTWATVAGYPVTLKPFGTPTTWAAPSTSTT